MLSGVDPSFLAAQRARAGERAARFAREASVGPPPLPTNRLTVSEGKVVRPREEADVLRAFILRKLSIDAPLDQGVLEKAKKLGINIRKLKEEAAANEDEAAMAGSSGPPASKKRGRGAAHVGLDDDLDDYFRASASPPKRVTSAAATFGKHQEQPPPQQKKKQKKQKLTEEEELKQLKEQWLADEAEEAAAEAARPPPPTASAVVDAELAGLAGDLTDEQADVVAATLKLLMGGGGGDESQSAPPHAASARKRGRSVRLGEPPPRWRLGFMLMARKHLRTSTTRAFFFPKMKLRRPPSLKLPRPRSRH